MSVNPPHLSKKEVSRIIRKNWSRSKSGSYSTFVPVNRNWGIKLFPDISTRNWAYEDQLKAFNHGLAPALGQKFDFDENDIEENDNYWRAGYITQKARLGKHPSLSSKNWDSYYNLSAKKVAIYNKFKEALAKIGMAEDLHSANFGTINRKLVKIDFW